MDKKKASKNSQAEIRKFEISGLLFAQIATVMIILIILLFIRLFHLPLFKGIMSEYNIIFGEDIPLSAITNNVSQKPTSQNPTDDKSGSTTEDTTGEREEDTPDTKITDNATENSDLDSIGGDDIESESDSKSDISVSGIEKATDTKTANGNIAQTSAATRVNEMQLPIKSGKLTSNFGYRTSPITGEYCLHDGVDLAAPIGTEIYAVLDGKVIASVEDEEIGYYVKIDHGNGVVTAYGHCSKLIAKEGDIVQKGDVIALVGSTGHSTGPHTHFEVRVDGVKINPAWVLDLSKLNAS